MNRNASLPVQLVGPSAPGSTDSLPRWQLGEQGSNPALGRIESLLAPPQCCTEIGQFGMQGLATAVTGAVAHAGAPGRPDTHQTRGSEHLGDSLDRLQCDPVGIPVLAVRRYLAARQACRADDLAPQNIGEPMARETIQLLRHTSTITKRRTTDTHCRHSVGVSFAAPDDNSARAAAVRPGPASPCPAHRTPSCGIVVDGTPMSWSACGGHGVPAVNLDAESPTLARQGRAV